ncbi:hypothetical protein NSQ96_12290 [Caldifermentibacillus hisashii]|uniref:hypothetical protein n=1 Tax=Caldifermentibacillus hisashii TaxID=996558 RepID=UPI0031FCB893
MKKYLNRFIKNDTGGALVFVEVIAMFVIPRFPKDREYVENIFPTGITEKCGLKGLWVTKNSILLP